MKGHIRKRGERSWELKFDLPHSRHSGDRRTAYHTFHGTKRQAQDELARLISEAKGGRRLEPSKLTLAEYLDQWLDAMSPSVTPQTHEWAEYLVRSHIAKRLGGIPLQELQPLDIQQFIAELLESGRCNGKGGLSVRTVRHIVSTLSQAMRQAVDWGMITQNPVSRAKMPKPEHRDVQVLDTAGIVSLLDTAKSTRLYVPILLAVCTGMRRGELLALRWEDIDLDSGVLSVNRSLEQARGELRFKAPKTKTSQRRVTLPNLAIEALRRHRVNQLKERMALGLGRDDCALAFTTVTGHPYWPKNFSKAFAKIVKRAGLDCTLHGLRHTHASQLLRDGVPVQTVSARLGHANPSITLGVYAHLLPGMEQEAAMRTDEALKKALSE